MNWLWANNDGMNTRNINNLYQVLSDGQLSELYQVLVKLQIFKLIFLFPDSDSDSDFT